MTVLKLPRYSYCNWCMAVGDFLSLAESICWKRGTRGGSALSLHCEWWMLLWEHEMQPTQASIEPTCGLNPTHVPLGYKWG